MKTKLRLTLYKIIMETNILEWLTNKPINHPDLEDKLKAMVNGLLINYSKMERKMDFQDQFCPMETIILVNTSMDHMKESLKSSMNEECY